MGGSSKGGKGGAPSAPNFSGLALQQGQLSKDAIREQTRANRPDQYGPFGYTDWTFTPDPMPAGGGASPGGVNPAMLQTAGGGAGGLGGILDKLRGGASGAPSGYDPGAGSWSQRTGFSGPLEEANQRLQGQIAEGAGIDPAAARDQAISAAYGQATSRLDPRFSQARSAREAQLANEGFSRGDEAWNRAMADFSRDENDAYQQAMYGAQTGAGNAAFGQSLAANMQPYQQLGSLAGLLRPAPFTPSGSSDPANLLAAAMQQYGAGMDQYNANQAGKNSMMSGATSLIPIFAMASSDERLKTEIERLPVDAIPGVPFARWKWKDTGDSGFGVIAQDLEKVRPDLVVEIGGIKHVRYGGLR